MAPDVHPLPGEWRHLGRLVPERGEPRGCGRGAGGYPSRGSISRHWERAGCVPVETSYPGQPFTAKPAARREPRRGGRAAAPASSRAPESRRPRPRPRPTDPAPLSGRRAPTGAELAAGVDAALNPCGEGARARGGGEDTLALGGRVGVTRETRRRAEHLDTGRRRARRVPQRDQAGDVP